MSEWPVNSIGSHSLHTCWMHFALGIGLKTVQWTETCHQVYGVDYWYMLCFDWINYFIVGTVKFWRLFVQDCNASYVHSFIPVACAECGDCMPFSGASSIPLCYVLFPATLLHQLFFHPLSPNLPSISWSASQSCCSQIHFGNFLPFSVHAQT